jgi:cyclophilin family peptidyl-prolyl cis-trans isomerase
MWHFIRDSRSQARRSIKGFRSRPRRQRTLQPFQEILEGRQLMTASLAPLPSITVPAQLGDQVALDGSGNGDGTQTYKVSSDNPTIAATIAQGPYWTLNVQHTASATPGDISFAGSLTFQLFQDLTPSTVAHIIQFTNDGYYNGKDFTRIIMNFPTITDYVAQGGAPNPIGTGTSGQPGTPFANEILQQLAFTGTGQLAMANAGPNTNDTQFFVTTGTPTFLDFHYTIFGQLVSGSNILSEMTQVATQPNPAIGGEKSLPINPIVINSATISTANASGVIHIDTSSARPGQTANITVTATDPRDGSHLTEAFNAAVGPYTGPTNPPINFVPFAVPSTSTTAQDQPVNIKLGGYSGYPGRFDQMFSVTLVSQPSHGTISQFYGPYATLVYTPDPGFTGTDSFQYAVQAWGTGMMPPQVATSLPATVTITVTAALQPPPLPPSPPPPLVTVVDVQDVMNKRHQVTEIGVNFSGAVNADQAQETGLYRLAMPGSKGSFTAKNARTIKLKSAVYNSVDDSVILIPEKPFALTKKVQLLVDGLPPTGLQDSEGRLIDGNHDGQAGGNAIAILSRSGVSSQSLVAPTAIGRSAAQADMIDVLVAQDELGNLFPSSHAKRHPR